MELTDYRNRINEIDEEIVRLFTERMDVSTKIAAYKKENRLPVYDAAREREKLNDVESRLPDGLKDYGLSLYSLLMDLSKNYQRSVLSDAHVQSARIRKAMEDTQELFPEKATVACQGVEGAYSQAACDRLFRLPNVLYFQTFDAVFGAIEKGLCRYGVIPLENSSAGSVNEVYDLMMKHNFSIVRSVRVKVDHNLLVKPGTKLSEIKEIYSHEQAISQCSAFLETLKDVKIIPYENTAMAAELVAKSERRDIAALSSRSCAELYELEVLQENVQNSGNNYTRFICISKDLEIYPGADRTSLMLILPHTPGALYKALSGFYARGVNINKLESRPIPERNFEFMFYFDVESSVYAPRFAELMDDMENLCEEFVYLGSYTEIV